MKNAYLKILLILALLCAGWTIQGQEICDNGIDDDGDGLIDLQDPDCACDGIYQFLPSDILPNGSFEEMNCCPSSFSELKCAANWEFGTNATTDYLHTCGWTIPAAQPSGLIPFPDGEGSAGMVFSNTWREYLSICLNDTLPLGSEVTMTFWISFISINNNGTLCSEPKTFVPVNFTIFGAPHCNNLTVIGSKCPTDFSTPWKEVGSVEIQPLNEWYEVSLTFTTTEDVTAIMLGPPCSLPGVFNDNPCFAYFLIDDIVIYESNLTTEIHISEVGHNCPVRDTLAAEMPYTESGDWQWYYDGIALSGQTASHLSLAEYNYALGNYQVVFTTSDGCAMGTILVDNHVLDTSVTLIGNTLLALEKNATYQWVDCDNEYEPIPGETDSIFTPGVDGYYAVIIQNGTCLDTSSCYNVMTVGIKETMLPRLRVYPNPTPGQLTLEFGQIIDRANLEIIDVFGRVTHLQEIRTAENIPLTLTGSPGMYWVRLYSEGEMLAVIRVMKE